jgi:hypothetical protein
VPGAGLLAPTETAGALATRYDAAIGALDRANGRVGDLIDLAATCQTRQAAVAAALDPPPWWKRLGRRKRAP